MNHDDIPMWDDPAESSALRQLLRAGRNAVSDYDVDRGLARHLAAVQAGGVLPKWAIGAAARGASTPLLTWLVVPLVAASAFVGVWFVSQQNQPPQPMVVPDQAVDPALARAVPHARPAPELLAAQTNAPQRVAAESATAPDDAKLATGDERSVRSGLRANVHPSTQRHQRNLDSGRTATRALDALTATSSDGPSTAILGGAQDAQASALHGTAAVEPAARQPGSRDPSLPPSAAEVAPRSTAGADDSPAKSTTSNPTSKAAGTNQTPEDDSRLEREMQMLAVAQRVLPNDPIRALRLTRQGDREFAGSMFSAERKEIGLLALVQLGRLDEARRLGAPFLLAYPNAPWSERLRRALATGHIPAP